MAVTLAREFDACGECRLDVGGPKKYRNLTDDEIREVVEALENKSKLDEAIDALKCIRDANYHGDMETLADIRWEIANNYLEKLK